MRPSPATEAMRQTVIAWVTCSLRGGKCHRGAAAMASPTVVATHRDRPVPHGRRAGQTVRYPGWLTLTIGGTVNSNRVACGHPADRSGADSGDTRGTAAAGVWGTPSRGVSSRAVAHTPSAGSPASVPGTLDTRRARGVPRRRGQHRFPGK